MIRVLIIDSNTKSGRIGGINTVIHNYYSAMDKNAFEYAFVYISDPPFKHRKLIKESGAKIFILERELKSLPRYFSSLKKIIIEGNYDIVYAHGSSRTIVLELLAAKLAGTKVRIAHSHSNNCTHKAAHNVLKPVFSKLYTHGFACSSLAGEWLFGKRHFTVIYNACDIYAFSFNEQIRIKLRAQYSLGNKTVIGHVGNFNPPKNHDFLVRAFYEYKKIDPDAVLFLIGDGMLKQSISDLAFSLGLSDSIIFAGQLDNVNEFYNIFDCFVLPSYSEGFGIVLVEAQANGLTVFATEGRIPKEVSVNSNFFFITLEEGPEIWAKKIESASFERCADATEHLVKAGFHIQAEAERLTNLLTSFVK